MITVDDLEAVGMGPCCPKCGQPTDWLPCHECGGEGYRDDLYEEDPLWYDPGDTEKCDYCGGLGGWWRCWDCKECFDNRLMHVVSMLSRAVSIRVGKRTWVKTQLGDWIF